MTPSHPAKFNRVILEKIATIIPQIHVKSQNPHKWFYGVEPLSIYDPFAGVGGIFELERLLPGVDVWATEIEPEWVIGSKYYDEGDRIGRRRFFAVDSLWYMDYIFRQVGARFDMVITSPCYGNRMADHHDATDGSVRNTYRHKLGRPLNEKSSAGLQWGPEYKMFHSLAWERAARIIKPGGALILNIKDHIRRGERMEVTAWHKECISQWMTYQCRYKIYTSGNRQGENHEQRIGYESILVFRKRPYITATDCYIHEAEPAEDQAASGQEAEM